MLIWFKIRLLLSCQSLKNEKLLVDGQLFVSVRIIVVNSQLLVNDLLLVNN